MEYSDQEQVDAIKRWWQENGLAVFVGVALGVSVLFGWNFYQNYQHTQRITASAIYERIMLHLQQEQYDEARVALHSLLSDYGNSTYAMLGALSIAQQDAKDEDFEVAHARLQWVLDRGELPELVHLARIRKARLYMSQNEVSEAEQLLMTVPTDETAFVASYAELRGDIAVANQQPEAAKTAYEKALASEELAGAHRQFIQMKLDNLGSADEEAIIAPPPGISVTEATATPSTTEALATPLTLDNAESISTPSTSTAPLPIAVTEPVATPNTMAALSAPLRLDTPDNTATPSTHAAPPAMAVIEDVSTPSSVAAVSVPLTPEISEQSDDTGTPSTHAASPAMAVAEVTATPNTVAVSSTSDLKMMPPPLTITTGTEAVPLTVTTETATPTTP